MKRLVVIAVALVLIVSMTFAFAAENQTEPAGSKVVSEDVEIFVKDVAQKKGLNEEDVEEVTEVNLTNLPEQINFENIDETNIALYQLKVKNETEPLFIITAGEKLIERQEKVFSNKFLLNLGLAEEIVDDTFLKTSAGVKTSLEKGYVMTESGSVTGLSTSLEVTSANAGDMIEILIYINGKEVGFRNTFIIDETGTMIDYDSVSQNTIKFSEGDVISLKVLLSEGVKVKDINTLLELTS